MAEEEGKPTYINVGVGHIGIRGQEVQIRMHIQSDKGIYDQLELMLGQYSTQELKAALDGAPFLKRLGLDTVIDDRNGDGAPLTEEQARYYIEEFLGHRRLRKVDFRSWAAIVIAALALLVSVFN